MKRIYLLLLLCFVALISCNKIREQFPTPPNREPEPYTLSYLSGIYYGKVNDATEECYNYFIVLSTDNNFLDVVTGEWYPKNNHKYLFIDLYSSIPSDNYNKKFYIPQGTYSLDTSNSNKVGSISSAFSYLYVTDTDNQQETHFTSCEVEVTDGAIHVTATDNYGTSYKYYTPKRGINNIENFGTKGISGKFSNLNSDISIDQCYALAEDFGDYYILGMKLWWLYITNDDRREMLLFELLTPIDAQSPVGEYSVSANLYKTHLALPGYVTGDGDIWSWYYREDTDGEVALFAPIKSGHLSVKSDSNCELAASFVVEDDKSHTISGKTTNFTTQE